MAISARPHLSLGPHASAALTGAFPFKRLDHQVNPQLHPSRFPDAFLKTGFHIRIPDGPYGTMSCGDL